MKVQLFLRYLKAQEEEDFEGPFAAWVGEELAEVLALDDGEDEPEVDVEEVRLPRACELGFRPYNHNRFRTMCPSQQAWASEVGLESNKSFRV